MKKLLTLLLAFTFVLCSLSFVACDDDTPQGGTTINVKYYAQASDIVPMILSGKETVGLVPEPAATALQKNAQKQGKTLYRLDLQELYDSDVKAYPQAVLMVKKSVIGAHQDLASLLAQKIDGSVAWAKENTTLAVSAISERGATTLQAPALNQTAIDGCKIYWQGSNEAKQSVKDYVNQIIQVDANSATAVQDDFFYNGEIAENSKASYTFVTPDGAPALAISKLMNDSDSLSTGKSISYQVVSALQVRNALVSGSADFVLAPVNMASKFYKEHDANDPYVMVAVVTHGNFYIISTEQISFSDLAGKQIAVPMKGAVPDWTFQTVAKKHGLTCATVE
ncbi:MAG: hypothetical protein IKB98_04410 [Clostridia bacterium]|nr:hypothetical protein [Clostridia bacterium]